MLDLAKFIKQLKDFNIDFHREISDKMKEAMHLIVSGAILCHSFIKSNKISKICEELVYVRGKMDRIKQDLHFQIQLTICHSVTFYTSRQQQHNDNEGEIEETCETQTQKMEMQFARLLKTSSHGQHKITGFEWLPIRFAIKELEIATNGFRCEIGRGRTGRVYKGILANGRKVAVKRTKKGASVKRTKFAIEFEATRLMTSRMTELVAIANLHHRNILKLLGFCIARKELMLVFDYMYHGTLSDFLFDPKMKQVLDWGRRFNVLLEIIRGLAFLHEGAYVRIVHRDIKPENILLDENFSARISDFELAVALQDNTNECVRAVVGTIGYIAPEYVSTGRFTEKADIYSFGVLVLSIVSGQKAFDLQALDNDLQANDDDVMLVDRAWMIQKENRLIELIDPELVKGPGFDSGDILRTIMIALLCVQKDPELRPPASRVLVMLSTKEVEIPTAPAPPESEGSSSYSSPLAELTDNLDDNNVCSVPLSVFNSPR